MLALKIRFLAGRYHATPWDRQVNEGTVEWPPSPWRLLRALVAASYRLNEPPSDKALAAVLQPLAESLPSYRVPPYAEGHTRHYMPLDGGRSGLIFDAFVVPGSGPDAEDGQLDVVWNDVDLEPGGVELLRALCDQISYLGRAESWAAIEPCTELRSEASPNCTPAKDGLSVDRVRLMAPARRAEHLAWVDEVTGGKKKKGVPKTLLDVLRQDVGDIRKNGWSSVPGTRWVVYDLNRPVAPRRRTPTNAEPPTFALYRMAGPVLPKVEKTLQTGECVHKALVSWSSKAGKDDEPHDIFKGASKPRGGSSGHAAVMPLDLNRDGFLDHLLVHAADGFDREARAVLEHGRRIHGVGAYAFAITLLGLWTRDEIQHVRPELGALPIGPARRWRSVTPFVLVRHPKLKSDGSPRLDDQGKWIDGPEAQVRLELQRRGIPEPASIAEVEFPELKGNRKLPWHRFQRRRLKGGGERGPDKAFGFELEFDEPVEGPISLGYGRFFGLGLFAQFD